MGASQAPAEGCLCGGPPAWPSRTRAPRHGPPALPFPPPSPPLPPARPPTPSALGRSNCLINSIFLLLVYSGLAGRGAPLWKIHRGLSAEASRRGLGADANAFLKEGKRLSGFRACRALSGTNRFAFFSPDNKGGPRIMIMKQSRIHHLFSFLRSPRALVNYAYESLICRERQRET